MNLITLRKIAEENDIPLETARKLVQFRPDLATLGTRFGVTRAYGPEEVSKIVGAWQEHQRIHARS